MDPNDDSRQRRPVGLIYDERMCGHCCPNKEHPESPERIIAIWEKLNSAGIPQKCAVLSAKEAEEKYIALVHTQKHINLIKKVGCGSEASDFQRRVRVASSFNSIYLNESSSLSAFLAAGAVIEVTEKVAKGELSSAIAIVRPPGHHAEPDEAMGFCLFNNVAIAASFLLNERQELGIKKILIVDWDVHHGNGTQKMFWNDPQVLYFSVHRFDFGSFYPAGDDGSHTMIGEGSGAGYNINVPWDHGQCGDADYLAVWDHILIPVVKAYNPDFILVSGGFDAAIGDPLGGCCLTPDGYFLMMSKLMKFANGKIVMALEGGYNLESLAKSVLACAEALLEEKRIIHPLVTQPFESTLRTILSVRQELSQYWPALAISLPQDIAVSTMKTFPTEIIISSSSDSDAEELQETAVLSEGRRLAFEEKDTEVVDDVIVPLSKLAVGEIGHGQQVTSCQSSSLRNQSYSSTQLPLPDQIASSSVQCRLPMSKIYIWYGAYGSNMWTPRFLCYIRGGQVEGMNNPCLGSKDKTLPKDITWETVSHRLFFARSSSKSWGSGGVAFLHPEKNIKDKAHIRLYKITLEQFNDILLQENAVLEESISPLFDYSALMHIRESKSLSLGALKRSDGMLGEWQGGWYSNILYLETLDDVPILTMTCTLSHIEDFKSGKIPMLGPSSGYMNILVKGLVEGKQLSETEAINYVKSSVLY